MLTLIVNAGSSSLKVSLYKENKKSFSLVKHLLYDGIGSDTKLVIGVKKRFVDVIDSAHALRHSIELIKEEFGDKISQVIHRVVHGGDFYNKPVYITQEVKDRISALSLLAPLHNPHNLSCIEVSERVLPQAKQYAVFDTAYHQSIPEQAFIYGLAKELTQKYKVRKYGFHGISHSFLSRRAYELTKKKKVITCHLGNGASITANNNQKSVDTSMGFTPSDGLLMGTRSGTLDPEVPLYLMRILRANRQKVHDLICSKGGFLGLTGNHDLRHAWKRKSEDDMKALSKLSYQIKQYIGSYAATLNGVDVIVFSGGVGENAWYVRKDALAKLDFLGVKLDLAKNRKAVAVTKPVAIHKRNSKVKIYVIPSNEEEEMLRQVKHIK